MESANVSLANVIRQDFKNRPATVVKLEQNVRQNHVLCDLVEALEAADVIFIHIFVQGTAKGDIGPDAGNPLVDATFNLQATLAC